MRPHIPWKIRLGRLCSSKIWFAEALCYKRLIRGSMPKQYSKGQWYNHFHVIFENARLYNGFHRFSMDLGPHFRAKLRHLGAKLAIKVPLEAPLGALGRHLGSKMLPKWVAKLLLELLFETKPSCQDNPPKAPKSERCTPRNGNRCAPEPLKLQSQSAN